MKVVVRVMPQARRDVGRLARFVASGSPVTARRARTATWSGIKSLDRFPDRGAPTPPPADGMRELHVPFGRAAYIIQYVSGGDLVIVLRIFHSLEER